MKKYYVYAFNLTTAKCCVVDILFSDVENRLGWYKDPISIEVWSSRVDGYKLIPYARFVELYGKINYP